MIAVEAEGAVGGLGDGVSFEDFEGEFAAAEAHRHFLHGGEEPFGEAQAPVFFGDDHIVDVEEWAALEGGEAFEGDDESGGFIAVHGQHDMRRGTVREGGRKVSLYCRRQSLAATVDAAGIAVEQQDDGVRMGRGGWIRLEDGDVHAGP